MQTQGSLRSLCQSNSNQNRLPHSGAGASWRLTLQGKVLNYSREPQSFGKEISRQFLASRVKLLGVILPEIWLLLSNISELFKHLCAWEWQQDATAIFRRKITPAALQLVRDLSAPEKRPANDRRENAYNRAWESRFPRHRRGICFPRAVFLNSSLKSQHLCLPMKQHLSQPQGRLLGSNLFGNGFIQIC